VAVEGGGVGLAAGDWWKRYLRHDFFGHNFKDICCREAGLVACAVRKLRCSGVRLQSVTAWATIGASAATY
jgi:hypothetical protein